jgi:hypothetical protein
MLVERGGIGLQLDDVDGSLLKCYGMLFRSDGLLFQW